MGVPRSRALPVGAGSSPDAVYEALRDTLQISWVPAVFEALAEVPAYLHLAWAQVGPVAETAQFVRLSEHIARDASAVVHSLYVPGYGPGDLQQLDVPLAQQAEIRSALDALAFGQSQTMLIIAALRLAVAGHPPGRDHAISWPRRATTWTLQPVPIVDEAAAGETVRRIFSEARQVLDLSPVPHALRVIAGLPRYVQLAWDDLAPLVQGSGFEAARAEIIEAAEKLCGLLPSRIDVTPSWLASRGLAPREIRRAQEILSSSLHDEATSLLVTVCLRFPLGGNSPSRRDWHPEGRSWLPSYP